MNASPFLIVFFLSFYARSNHNDRIINAILTLLNLIFLVTRDISNSYTTGIVAGETVINIEREEKSVRVYTSYSDNKSNSGRNSSIVIFVMITVIIINVRSTNFSFPSLTDNYLL